jgi:ferredoxin
VPNVKVIVDADRCEAHGECVVAAPEMFDLGEEDDVVRVIDPAPAEELRSKAELAARTCPVLAIRVEG